jgi:hypothetical protein
MSIRNRVGKPEWDTLYKEFRELFGIVESSLSQNGRGDRQKLEPIGRLFIFLLDSLSGGIAKRITTNHGISLLLA